MFADCLALPAKEHGSVSGFTEPVGGVGAAQPSVVRAVEQVVNLHSNLQTSTERVRNVDAGDRIRALPSCGNRYSARRAARVAAASGLAVRLDSHTDL
jgi:hypothetical protein